MSALIHHKHLLNVKHNTEDVLPKSETNSISKKSSRSCLAPCTEKEGANALSTGPLDKKRSLYPMHFSNNRKEYFTTNHEGKVVVIANPSKQFQTTGKISQKFIGEINYTVSSQQNPVLKLAESIKHTSKHYCSIASLNVTESKHSLASVLAVMRESSSNEEASENYVVSEIVSKILDDKQSENIDFFEQIPETPEFIDLKNTLKQTYFHAYTEEHWMRVKRVVMEIIGLYKLQAILLDTPEGYRHEFGHASDFITVDTMISYTLMSLVHFSLFNKRSHEVSFFKRLSAESQKTKYVLKFIDRVVYKDFRDDECGVSRADKALVRFALPNCKEHMRLMCLHESSGYVLKFYTKGIEVKSWYKSLYQRAAANYEIESQSIKQLKQCVRNFEISNTDDWCTVSEEDERMVSMKEELEFLLNGKYFLNPEDFVV